MPRLYLVRHGRAASGFDTADPGLDELGRSQADKVARTLAPKGPLAIVSSPLLRTRQTAKPLSLLWKRELAIEDAVAEIPSPPELSLADRVRWLQQIMEGSWREVGPALATWRERVIATLVSLPEDSVVFSHFVAINVALGAATETDRVLAFSPDNCSVTLFETDGTKLTLIERGAEAPRTRVN